MLDFGVKCSSPELLAFCFCLLTLSGIILGQEHGPAVIRVVVEEGSDVILPCSLSTKERIVQKRFDWKKDGEKKVFLYDAGITGQDKQFKGRVSHFIDELKFGNASIIIRNTTASDSGDYTCDFPHLQPNGQISHIQLVVGEGKFAVCQTSTGRGERVSLEIPTQDKV